MLAGRCGAIRDESVRGQSSRSGVSNSVRAEFVEFASDRRVIGIDPGGLGARDQQLVGNANPAGQRAAKRPREQARRSIDGLELIVYRCDAIDAGSAVERLRDTVDLLDKPFAGALGGDQGPRRATTEGVAELDDFGPACSDLQRKG